MDTCQDSRHLGLQAHGLLVISGRRWSDGEQTRPKPWLVDGAYRLHGLFGWRISSPAGFCSFLSWHRDIFGYLGWILQHSPTISEPFTNHSFTFFVRDDSREPGNEYCNPKMPKIDWTDVHTISSLGVQSPWQMTPLLRPLKCWRLMTVQVGPPFRAKLGAG